VRQAIDDIARIVGATNVKITKVPTLALRVLGLFNTDIRELPKTLYQFEVRSSSTTPRHELPSVSCRLPGTKS